MSFVLEISPNYCCRKPETWRGKDEFREQHLFEVRTLQLHHGTGRRKGKGFKIPSARCRRRMPTPFWDASMTAACSAFKTYNSIRYSA